MTTDDNFPNDFRDDAGRPWGEDNPRILSETDFEVWDLD